MKKLAAILIVMIFFCGTSYSQEPQKKEGKKQFIYVLKLIPRLLDEKNWTEQDKSIVGKHFRRLQRLHKEGRVVLAGRTLNESDASQFGVVVLEVGSEEEARRIMEEDDAVKEKIMTAQLFPFSVALIR